jgi:hypothetical protein
MVEVLGDLPYLLLLGFAVYWYLNSEDDLDGGHFVRAN